MDYKYLLLKSILIGLVLSILIGVMVTEPYVYHTYPKGARNLAITEANMKETICNYGVWKTSSIRPPVSYTNKIKIDLFNSLKLSGAPKDYELDHCIPLTLGGAPTSTDNLWMEPYAGDYGARQKDKVEMYLNKQVCAGKMSLKDAQRIICSDEWKKVYDSINTFGAPTLGEDGEID